MPYLIGLMSGTSLDGCDAALIERSQDSVRLLAFITLPMPAELHARILDCCSLERSNIALTCSLNVELGHWFVEAARAVCERANVSLKEIAAIGSHGQTVYHIPHDKPGLHASTLQLGEPAVISHETGVAVVSSFRAMDMAAGGRGAPLVPYAEYLLYRSDTNRALQNIGGIGNVTILPANATLDDIFAFDTGPGNMIIDALAQHFYQIDFDRGGAIAATGSVNACLLDAWMAVPFVAAPPPKATGRELYGAQFISHALVDYPLISPADWLATATRYTAATIAVNYRLHVFPRCPVQQVILSGGGAHNLTLRRDLASLIPECELLTQEDLGFDSDAKEAIAFALLADETMHRHPGNVPGATGARRPVILGSITPAPLAID